MTTVCVPISLGSRSYEVAIGERLLGDLSAYVEAAEPTSTILITDSNVGPLHAHAVTEALAPTAAIEVPAGEKSKSLEQLGHLYDECFATRQLDRGTMVVALGGGMIGDLAGYAAATLMRGIRHVHVPTSLLAMVDSSVGGKTAINHPAGKNLIGAFHQPVAVFCDLELLKTLPEREYVSALAEVAKTAVLSGEDFVALLEMNAQRLLDRDPGIVREVVERCVRFKAEVVIDDERETSGRRATLNLGHTLAHVVETAFPGDFLHGEAVAIGLNAALRLSIVDAGLRADVAARVRELLRALQLPIEVPAELGAERMLEVMATDKKRRSDVVNFVVMSALGDAATSARTLDDSLASFLLGRQ